MAFGGFLFGFCWALLALGTLLGGPSYGTYCDDSEQPLPSRKLRTLPVGTAKQLDVRREAPETHKSISYRVQGLRALVRRVLFSGLHDTTTWGHTFHLCCVCTYISISIHAQIRLSTSVLCSPKEVWGLLVLKVLNGPCFEDY